tara:strand:- start:32990 stop:34174 length:1185 start_codon:yes stop_codon:yes gene_type:complete
MINEIIPYGKHEITEEDINSVIEVLKTDNLTQGKNIFKFEENYAKYVKSKYAVAVSNGTAALHLCALALGVKPGDKVITTPITFVASANCVRYCGGEVVFSDIDPTNYLLDLKKIEKLLSSSPPGTFKGIIPVNFAGHCNNLEKLKKIANKYNLWIIEDSCHSPGGYFIDSDGKKQLSGNGSFADLSIFSFHPVKHIATGEGGMITTNNPELYKLLLSLRSHGIYKNQSSFKNKLDISGGNKTYPNWYMEMQNLGYNYRLTDIQSALGISQLKRAEYNIERRREIAKIYNDEFAKNQNIKSHSGFIPGHAYHLYIIEVEERLELYNFLRKNKIFTQIHYIPCHYMPYYQDIGWKKGDFPVAENYYRRCISLPMYPTLGKKQYYVIDKINEFYGT